MLIFVIKNYKTVHNNYFEELVKKFQDGGNIQSTMGSRYEKQVNWYIMLITIIKHVDINSDNGYG